MLSFEPISRMHLPSLAEIYNYYIKNTTVLFFEQRMTAGDFADLITTHSKRFRHFAVVEGGRVVGHAAIKPHSTRTAYDVTADVTIILAQSATGHGHGSDTLYFLESLARENGFHSLLAQICGENTTSIHFFAKHGFTRCAMLKEVGYKFGRYLDIVIFQKML